jgi:hypothetical protein
MTLNASGPISLGGSTTGESINLELSQSATAQVSMNDANVRSLAEVASGAIIVPTNFYGKSSVTISITDQSISDATTDPVIPQAGYRLSSNGKVYEVTTSGGATELETWCTPTAQASNYEALATIVSGSLTSGTTGSWLALSTTRDWYLEEYSIDNTSACQFTVQIRRVGTATVLDTATIDLTATLFS